VIALEAVRLALNQRLVESSFTGILQQAAAIQRSLLPDPLPSLPGFDLAARSVPAESVGGDAYDALSLGPDTLAFAVADASGHGLPAALEARDVVVGLRMGAARHMKIGATVEKLNGILCRSTLSSRFVSLVYGELEADGRFQFVNAGHPHPILVNPGSTTPFPETGMVLGVEPGVRHRIQHGEIAPGGALLIVTDGVLECLSPSGEEFGAERVAFLARALGGRPAAWIVGALFEALENHSRERSLADDATALVIRRE
jgi:sigma-B regulation protein RsbU (phosphoserine phosphatase)